MSDFLDENLVALHDIVEFDVSSDGKYVTMKMCSQDNNPTEIVISSDKLEEIVALSSSAMTEALKKQYRDETVRYLLPAQSITCLPLLERNSYAVSVGFGESTISFQIEQKELSDFNKRATIYLDLPDNESASKRLN